MDNNAKRGRHLKGRSRKRASGTAGKEEKARWTHGHYRDRGGDPRCSARGISDLPRSLQPDEHQAAPPRPEPTAAPAAVIEATPEVTATPEPTPRPLTEEEKAELEEMELRSSLAESAEDVMSDSNVYNILLIGSDGRTEELERSDAMILLSINKTTKTMWLTSLMRDTQVEIAELGHRPSELGDALRRRGYAHQHDREHEKLCCQRG